MGIPRPHRCRWPWWKLLKRVGLRMVIKLLSSLLVRGLPGVRPWCKWVLEKSALPMLYFLSGVLVIWQNEAVRLFWILLRLLFSPFIAGLALNENKPSLREAASLVSLGCPTLGFWLFRFFGFALFSG